MQTAKGGHNFKCQKHPNKKADFIVINRSDFYASSSCSNCALQENQQKKNLVLIQEVIESDENSIIANWPLLNNNNLISKILDLSEQLQISEDRERISIIKNYFSEVKETLITKIGELEQSMIDQTSGMMYQEFIKVYKKISMKEELKNLLLGNDQINDQITNFLQKIAQSKEQNQKVIEECIKEYENKSQSFNQVESNSFFQEIYRAIDDIKSGERKYHQIVFHKFNFQNANEAIKNIMKVDLPNALNELSTQVQKDINSKYPSSYDPFKEKINTITQNLQTQIYQLNIMEDSLDGCLKNALMNKQVSKFVNVSNMSVSLNEGGLVGFIDIPITKFYINSSFRVKLKNAGSWTGIGIIDKYKLLDNGQEFKYSNNQVSTSYMFSSNGYNWTMIGKQPYESNSLLFGSGDILKFTIKKKSLEMVVETKNNQTRSIEMSLDPNRMYCIGFRMDHNEECFEFI